MKPISRTVRISVLAVLFTLILLFYTLRLMDFQVVNGETYAQQLDQTRETNQIIQAARGEILDRNGRPLAMNTIGRNVVIDMAYMETGTTNEVIRTLIGIMEEADEDWIDNLPLTGKAPFQFKPGFDDQVARLKTTLGVAQYATADDVVAHLRKNYKLENYNDTDFRKIAGVRYEMTRSGFDMATPYTFATDIKIETVPKIMERDFEMPGVDVVESTIRQYVSGDIAPHIVGQVGKIYKEQWDAAIKENGYKMIDGVSYAEIGGQLYKMSDTIGKDGAELAFEQYLKGQDGRRKIVLNSQNDVIDVIDEKEPVPGNSVVLTIDSRIQKVAQDALEKKIISMQNDLANYPVGRGHEANAGAVAVVNVKSGEVLALATYPSYNLANYQRDYSELAADPLNPLWNRALLGNYTPGSIFKPVVALASINEGIIAPGETVNCTGIYHFAAAPSYQPRCLRVDGPINVYNALRVSCNIYFYDVGYRLGIEKINEYAAKLGLGQPTGIELSEFRGQVSSPELKQKLHRGEDKQWVPGDVIQTSIGQLDSQFSPLQLANYCATLANRGKRMKLSILKSVKSYSFEETVYEHNPEVVEEIQADVAFQAIHDGMVLASGPTGTAGSTFGNYEIKTASKTGTPETKEFPNSTFISYAPADDPEIAVCVVIEKGWHGYTGAPVTREVYDAYFNLGAGESADSVNYGELVP